MTFSQKQVLHNISSELGDSTLFAKEPFLRPFSMSLIYVWLNFACFYFIHLHFFFKLTFSKK